MTGCRLLSCHWTGAWCVVGNVSSMSRFSQPLVNTPIPVMTVYVIVYTPPVLMLQVLVETLCKYQFMPLGTQVVSCGCNLNL